VTVSKEKSHKQTRSAYFSAWTIRFAVSACLFLVAASTVHAQNKELTLGSTKMHVDLFTLQAGEGFKFGDATLSDKGKARISEILEVLEGQYIYRVNVIGHTDKIGDADLNTQLSLARAKAVGAHLIESGVSENRVKVSGIGAAEPLVGCTGLKGDELVQCLAPNRRTEIQFVYPQTLTRGFIGVREHIASAGVDFIRPHSRQAISTRFAKSAIKVFLEGCKTEVDSYCSQVTPGEQRILACMYAHNDKISESCGRSIKDATLLIQSEFAQANFVGKLCGSDIIESCADVSPGDGRISSCLQDKSAELSAPCRRALEISRIHQVR